MSVHVEPEYAIGTTRQAVIRVVEGLAKNQPPQYNTLLIKFFHSAA